MDNASIGDIAGKIRAAEEAHSTAGSVTSSNHRDLLNARGLEEAEAASLPTDPRIVGLNQVND